MNILIFIAIAYFLGSIPSGVWIGKFFRKIDIREYGSRNSGATNSYRVLGAKLGLLVLFFDVLKGYISLFIASKYILSSNLLALVGLTAILAHTYSCFINFKGGKGVATSLGVFAFLVPKITIILIIIFVVVVSISKYISLGSVVCATLLPVLIIIFKFNQMRENIVLISVSILVAIFVLYRHRSNISRLKSGYENKFKF